MENQVCTESQMRTLRELGINGNIGSISFQEVYDLPRDRITERTFTIYDMLNMIPESIKQYNDVYYHLRRYNGFYVSGYLAYSGMDKDEYVCSSENLRDAVYGTLLQLAQDGKL